MTNTQIASTLLQSMNIGSKVVGHGGQTMIITKFTENHIVGISEYCLNKFGKEVELLLSYSTLFNPHYNKNIKVL